MNYRIDAEGGQPAYIQLYRQLVADITAGVYTAGQKLPSKRTVAEECGVSVITVEHAYGLLCEEGYALSRERSGYFVLYRPADFLSRSFGFPLQTAGKKNPPAALPALPEDSYPYPALAKTMRKVLSDYGEELLIKSANCGHDILRTEISAYLARSRGIFVQPSQVVIGSGAEYLYGLIAQLFGRERIFALEDPSYAKIRKVYEAMGISCRMLTMTASGLSSESLAGTDADVLHVTPFHSFPSGVSIDISKKREYLSWAADRDGMIIEDNYDSELTVSKKEEDTLFALTDRENVLYLNTFSKTVAPSMRAGYLVLPEKLLSKKKKKLGFYSCTVPVFEQLLLAEILRSGDFERHINRVRRKRRKQEAKL